MLFSSLSSDLIQALQLNQDAPQLSEQRRCQRSGKTEMLFSSLSRDAVSALEMNGDALWLSR
jgi:hypothetical protein